PTPSRHEAGGPLPSWSETATKQTLLDFVDRVTRPGGPDYVPPERRLATFDLDGTLGCEKPDYVEVVVAMRRLCERAIEQPALLDDSLYRAACDGDRTTVDADVEQALLQAFEGESQSAYVDYVQRFLSTAHHPRFDRPYGQLYFLPMLELVDHLRAHGFAVYVVSGSQQGFVRAFAREVLGLGAERAMGHAVELDVVFDDGATVLRRGSAFRAPGLDGAGKAEVIRQRLGGPPILAFGNSMGDFEMLRYATTGEHPGLGLILVHDDPEEYVYRDAELIGHAEQYGWQVVGMRDDFERIFPP
ncbi:MAG: HAD family hydrolase, partial [Acidobacteriota bacterium]